MLKRQREASIVVPQGGETGDDGQDDGGDGGIPPRPRRQNRRRTSTRRAARSRSRRVRSCRQKRKRQSSFSAAPIATSDAAEAEAEEVIFFSAPKPMTDVDVSGKDVEDDEQQPPSTTNDENAPPARRSTAPAFIPRVFLPAPPGVAGPPELQMMQQQKQQRQEHHQPQATISPFTFLTASSPVHFTPRSTFIRPRMGNTIGLMTPVPSYATIQTGQLHVPGRMELLASPTTTDTTRAPDPVAVDTAVTATSNGTTTPLDDIADAAQCIEAASTLMLLIPNLSE